jgi:ferritin-like metal-binding protein YciE
MQIINLKDMYIAELQELVSMEGQLADELPRMAAVASHPSLKNILMHHREETQVQRERLESILQKHGANPRAHTDQAMQALVNETEMMLGMLNGNDLRDAGLIASAQSSNITKSQLMAPLRLWLASSTCAMISKCCMRALRRKSRPTFG